MKLVYSIYRKNNNSDIELKVGLKPIFTFSFGISLELEVEPLQYSTWFPGVSNATLRVAA